MSFRKNTKNNFKTSKKDYILSIDDFCLFFIFSRVGSQKAGALSEISTNRQKNFTEVIFKVPLFKPNPTFLTFQHSTKKSGSSSLLNYNGHLAFYRSEKPAGISRNTIL